MISTTSPRIVFVGEHTNWTSKWMYFNDDSNSSYSRNEFSDYNITEVNPVPMNTGISKEQSGASGFCKMLDLAIKNQDKSIPFQPFALGQNSFATRVALEKNIKLIGITILNLL